MGQLRRKLRSVKSSLSHAGVLRTVQRAFQRIVPEHIIDLNGIVFISADLQDVLDEREGHPTHPDLRHRWSTEQDLDLLTCGGMTRDEIQKCFEAGGRAVVTTTTAGEVVGYYWAIPRSWEIYSWIRCRIEPHEYWGGHVYTAPAFRGQGIMKEIRTFAYGKLMSEGFERVAGAVQSLNRSSLRVWSTPADKIVGHIVYLRLGHFVAYRMGRKWGAGFYAGGNPFEVSTANLEAAQGETNAR